VDGALERSDEPLYSPCVWRPAIGAEQAKGSEVAECMFGFAGRACA